MSAFKLQVSGCKLQVASCRLWLADCSCTFDWVCVDMHQPLKIGQWKWGLVVGGNGILWHAMVENANGNGNRNENR